MCFDTLNDVQPSGDEPLQLREIWPAGTLIKGDYAIQNKIGSGGFGTVYLAQHRFLGTTHVIKRLHEQFASDPEYVRKFVNEARAMRRLKDCPNIVEVEHMTQSEDGHLILVMEHIQGGDLGGLIDARPLRVGEVVEFARQIANGLHAAHESGLVHRDIKPQNVMISHDSTGKAVLKLIDFGIAADHRGSEQTSVMRRGSMGYAAPEQWMKTGKDLDGRADLYSLGATMYHMLCGRMPYDAAGIGDWIEQARAKVPVAPLELRPEIPKELSDLILRLLAYRPEDRPADAAALIQELNAVRIVESEEWGTGQTVLIERPDPPPGRRRFGMLAGGAAVSVAAASGIGWFAFGRKPLTPPPAAAVDLSAPAALAQPDHAALGDAAWKAKDFATAFTHFSAMGDAQRLQSLQRAVEGDSELRTTGFLDQGEYAKALQLVDGWIRRFPGSARLKALHARIVRARDAQ